MPRKGENIYKRKDGRWEGRYIRSYDSEHKAKYAYVYGKTYSEVKRKLTEQRGNVQKVQPTKNKSSTYGELLDCWLHSMQFEISSFLGNKSEEIIEHLDDQAKGAIRAMVMMEYARCNSITNDAVIKSLVSCGSSTESIL